MSNCADLGEILETVKVITEGDVQSWYTGWKATASQVPEPSHPRSATDEWLLPQALKEARYDILKTRWLPTLAAHDDGDGFLHALTGASRRATPRMIFGNWLWPENYRRVRGHRQARRPSITNPAA